MSVHTNFSTSETLELANTFCPPFSQRVYSIGNTPVLFESLEMGQPYWCITISPQEPFPMVHTELIEITSILDNGVQGTSLLTGAAVDISSTVQFFPAQKRQPYIPREELILDANLSLAIAYFEGLLPEDLMYGQGVLNPIVPVPSEPYTSGCSWGYGDCYSFVHCDALNLSAGDWCVIAGDSAKYGEYGRDKRLRVRLYSGGDYVQCGGFAYIDVPLDADSWGSYRAWKRQTVAVNVFSLNHPVEYDGFVSEYLRWIQDHTRYRKIEPMFDSLADVPAELLNPPSNTRLQRIWVMVSKSRTGYEVVSPICLQTGELLSTGGREALYQIDTTSIELPTCPSCGHWHVPVPDEEICMSCREIQKVAPHVSSKVHKWLRKLRVEMRIEVAHVPTESTLGHWVIHNSGQSWTDSIYVPDFFHQAPSSLKGIDHHQWKDETGTVEIRQFTTTVESLDSDLNVEENVTRVTDKIELWIQPGSPDTGTTSMLTPLLVG